MLLNFTFSNYRSFKSEQYFSMERSNSIDFRKDSILITTPGGQENISRVAAFYGANAAGKSNFLSALQHLRDLVISDDVKSDNYISIKEQPSNFGLSFVAKNNFKYTYSLKIQNNIVIDEKLYIYKSNRHTKIFNYSKEEDCLSLGSMFKDDEKTAIKFNFEKHQNQPIIRQLKISNSAEARFAFGFFYEEIFPSISNRVGNSANPTKLAHIIEQDEEIHNFLNDTLFAADLGIKSVNLVEADSGANKKQQEILSRAMIDFAKASNPKMSEEEIRALEKSSAFMNKLKKAMFEHEIDGISASFDVSKESDGTMAACGILLDLLPILKNGYVYIIDELDRSLHPSVVSQIIDIFNSSSTNPNNAQLIFSTHDVSLLDATIYGEDVLDRDEVWFVEKDNNGCSQIYPLTDIKYSTKKSDNIYKKYVGGKYGATPRVSLSYIVELYWKGVNETLEK